MSLMQRQSERGPAIETEALTKVYKSGAHTIEAVRGLNLVVPRGSIYALLGPNGAGKSSTVGMLTTLIPPTSGRASVAGHDVVREADEVRARIGVTFQEMVLDKALTGRQILDIHGRLYGLPAELRHQRMKQLFGFAGLGDAIDRPVKGYSGGMKRRLELVRGLMTTPEVLFLDEPTQGLDPHNRAAMWELLGMLTREAGLTILLTTHFMEEAEVLATQVGIIDHGRLIVEGRPTDLVAGLGADVVLMRGRGAVGTFLQALKGRDFVQAVQVAEADPLQPTAVSIGVDHGNRRLAECVTLAQESGFGIEEVAINRPSLGDVFLRYTGRALRDM